MEISPELHSLDNYGGRDVMVQMPCPVLIIHGLGHSWVLPSAASDKSGPFEHKLCHATKDMPELDLSTISWWRCTESLGR
jgi:hypothetical protein